MFERIKFTIAAAKLFSAWGSDPDNPTINETIVFEPVMFLATKRKKSYVFANKYACADGALILCAYALKILEGAGAPEHITSDLKQKTAIAIQNQFSISGAELSKMQANRLSLFGQLLDAHEDDISPMIEEAALVFSYDLHYGRYVEYTENSPLIIMPVKEKMLVETETFAFFHATLKMVTDRMKQYFQ